MSRRRTTLARFAAALLLSAAAVGGLAAQDADAGKGDASQLSLGLSGDHEFRLALPAGSDSWATGYDGTMKYPELVSDLGIKASQGPVSVVSSWEITSSSQGGPANLESYSLQDLESYIAWSPERFRLGFGYQIFSWGVSDGRNPTDNINPVDYTNLEGDKVESCPSSPSRPPGIRATSGRSTRSSCPTRRTASSRWTMPPRSGPASRVRACRSACPPRRSPTLPRISSREAS